MVTRRVIRITAAEAAAAKSKASPNVADGSIINTSANNEIGSSSLSDILPGCSTKHSKSTGGNSDPPKEVIAKKRDVPTSEEPTSNKKSKKRQRSNSFTIDLSDVPPQSPIPKDKTDGRTKEVTSKYTGVSWNKQKKKWIAMIRLEGKLRYIGNYENEEEAGIDYARVIFKYKSKEASTKTKKRRRSNSFSIDLSDVPKQSPIPKIKTDGRMKEKASRYTGVVWNQKMNKWHAQILIEGKVRYIGCYDNEEDAGMNYARAVYKYKGKKALDEARVQASQIKYELDLSDVPSILPIVKSGDGRTKENTSKYTGVSWNKSVNRWTAKITHKGKPRYIGSYANEEDAGIDYARAVFKYKGKEALDKARVKASQIKFELDLSDVPSISPILKSGKRGTETLSRYAGVYFDKSYKKWMSRINMEGKQRLIGSYESEEKAAVDYARALLKYKGQEALDNARKQAAQCKLETPNMSSSVRDTRIENDSNCDVRQSDKSLRGCELKLGNCIEGYSNPPEEVFAKKRDVPAYEAMCNEISERRRRSNSFETNAVNGCLRNTSGNREIGSSKLSDMLPGCSLKHSKSTGGNSDPPREVVEKRDVPTEEPTSNKEQKKRKRSKSFTIDLSDVPTQSPIPKDKTDGRMKDRASKFTGVAWNKKSKKWVAQISIEGKARRIGYYDSEEEAGIDYARAVYKYKGEEAREKSKKRRRSNSFVIDLSDVPPQSPIFKSKTDGRMKDRASKYIGVYWDKQVNKWSACISIEGKSRRIGYYTNEEEAGIDYARAVLKYRGKETLDKARVHASQIKFELDLSDVPLISPILNSGKRVTEASSRYVGVSFHKGKKRWTSQILLKGKQRHIGSYESEEKAAINYARALLKYRGQGALDDARKQAAQEFRVDTTKLTAVRRFTVCDLK